MNQTRKKEGNKGNKSLGDGWPRADYYTNPYPGVQSIGREPNEVSLTFPWGRREIMGGPYPARDPENPGIKLAAEISLPCSLDLPTRDFKTPDVKQTEKVLMAAITMMHSGMVPYAGCAYGQGRTGLFLATLIKAADKSMIRWWQKAPDPILRVRELYIPEACETKGQEKFVEDFDVRRIVKLIHLLK